MRDQSNTESSRIVPTADGPEPSGAEQSGPEQSWPRRNKRWLIPVGGLVTLLAITSVVFAVWRTDEVAVRPGSVEGVPSRVTVSGADTYPPENEIALVTVLVSQRLNIWQRIGAEFESGVDIEPERSFTGDVTRQQLRNLNQQRMQSSQHTAVVVALEHLGYEIPREATGVIVAAFVEGAPASEALALGDVIVGIDGTPVAELSDLAGVLAQRRAGQEVTLDVEPAAMNPAEGSPVKTAKVELIQFPDDPERALIGIQAQNRTDIGELPVDIEIDSGAIGGPSAGLALTLAVIDLLTPGELTEGLSVAATGTISFDGTVGAIGEVDQKAIAAERAGVDLLLVPTANLPEALDHAGDSMRVVGVDTLAEALAALAEN